MGFGSHLIFLKPMFNNPSAACTLLINVSVVNGRWQLRPLLQVIGDDHLIAAINCHFPIARIISTVSLCFIRTRLPLRSINVHATYPSWPLPLAATIPVPPALATTAAHASVSFPGWEGLPTSLTVSRSYLLAISVLPIGDNSCFFFLSLYIYIKLLVCVLRVWFYGCRLVSWLLNIE